MKKLCMIVGATIVLNGLSASNAFADWKGYAGLNCMSSSNSNDVRRSTSGAVNWQANSTIVYCPVVRDVEAGGPGGIEAASVRLFNNNQNSGGRCTLVSRTVSGAFHDWETQSWPAGYADHTINFGPIDTSNWGNIALYCSLPGVDGTRKSFIRSYAIEE